MNEEKRFCILQVKGMRCGACEGHVNDVVRKLEGVISVKSSVKKENCEIIYKNPSKTDDFIKAIIAVGYDASLAKDEPYQKRGLFAKLFHKS